MRYQIFQAPGMFSGEPARAQRVGTVNGSSVRSVSPELSKTVLDYVKKEYKVETGDVVITPVMDDGYSKETKTRFLSLRAFVKMASEKPSIFNFYVVETEL